MNSPCLFIFLLAPVQLKCRNKKRKQKGNRQFKILQSNKEPDWRNFPPQSPLWACLPSANPPFPPLGGERGCEKAPKTKGRFQSSGLKYRNKKRKCNSASTKPKEINKARNSLALNFTLWCFYQNTLFQIATIFLRGSLKNCNNIIIGGRIGIAQN